MGLKVLLIHPHFSFEMPQFVRGLVEVGAEVHGVSESPIDMLPPAVRPYLASHTAVSSLTDQGRLVAELLPVARQIRPDRVETQFEYAILAAAQLRDTLGIPGMSHEEAVGFRDKSVMRERVGAAGLPIPKSRRVHDTRAAIAAAKEIGYPVVLKPIDGAGCAGIRRIEDEGQLTEALQDFDVARGQVEEFVDGDEFTYDAIYLDGRPVFESVARYYPRPLESRTREEVGLSLIVVRDPATEADGVALGRSVHEALRVRTGFTHAEWYKRTDGSVVFGEIAARASGGHLVELMNHVNGIDLYREWARVVCHGAFTALPSRAFYGGLVFKRARGEGTIVRIEGMDELKERFPGTLAADWLSPVGELRRDWRSSHFADGLVLVRHPDRDVCRSVTEFIERDVQLYAEPRPAVPSVP